MDRPRHAGVARARQRAIGRLRGDGHLSRTARLAPLALAAALACGALGTDLDQVVALEIVLPDSGVMLVGDTLRPGARALNGRGDSVAAAIFWTSLDTATIAVLDSATGATLGKAVGTGRLQARTGLLRSNPQSVIVRAPPAPPSPGMMP